MRRHVFLFHGINTMRLDYAEGLIEALPDYRLDLTPCHWGQEVFDEVMEWRARARMRRTWNPLRALRRRWMRAAHESAIWLRVYNNEEQRNRILCHAGASVRRIVRPGVDRLAFIGHSLGSVVVVDLLADLLQSGVVQPEELALVVTMGSPLCYWRRPDQLRKFFEPIASSCQWVNLFDPDDPVSGPWGLAQIDGRIEDRIVETGGLIRAHVNYWSSPEIGATVRQLLIDNGV